MLRYRLYDSGDAMSESKADFYAKFLMENNRKLGLYGHEHSIGQFIIDLNSENKSLKKRLEKFERIKTVYESEHAVQILKLSKLLQKEMAKSYNPDRNAITAICQEIQNSTNAIYKWARGIESEQEHG